MKEPVDTPRVSNPESAHELYMRISPVSVTFGHGTDLTDKTFTSANHLLKEFHRLGRERIPLRFVMSGNRVLDDSSRWALNAYLEFVYGRKSLNQLRAGNLHRFAWRDIQRKVGLRWCPLQGDSPER